MKKQKTEKYYQEFIRSQIQNKKDNQKQKNKIKLLRENQNKAETREQFRNADSNTKVSELFLEKIKTTNQRTAKMQNGDFPPSVRMYPDLEDFPHSVRMYPNLEQDNRNHSQVLSQKRQTMNIET